MLQSNYECEFEPETLAAIKEICGEESEEYARARRNDAQGLMVKLRQASWPLTLRIDPQLALAISEDPSILTFMIDRAKAVAELAATVDKEWLEKCPLEAATRAARRHKTENKGLYIAS